jgi:hypothetical protein
VVLLGLLRARVFAAPTAPTRPPRHMPAHDESTSPNRSDVLLPRGLAPSLAPSLAPDHAIFHDHATFGGHGFSRDGVHWTYTPTAPFSADIQFVDGEVVSMQRRERPHLILDSAGRPTHLVTSVQPPPGRPTSPPTGFRNDRTYTHIQRVRRDDRPHGASPPRLDPPPFRLIHDIPGRHASTHFTASVRSHTNSSWTRAYVLQTTARNASGAGGCGYFAHLDGWSASWLSLEVCSQARSADSCSAARPKQLDGPVVVPTSALRWP